MVFCDRVSYNSGQPEATLVAEDDPELLNLGLQACATMPSLIFFRGGLGWGKRTGFLCAALTDQEITQ